MGARSEWTPLKPKTIGKYSCESEKIYPVIEKYLQGTIYDVGCGPHKICPDATGFDVVNKSDVDVLCGDLTFMPELIGSANVLFSSHCLEHVPNDYAKLMEWHQILKTGGTLILYLPDGRYYDNYENPDHVRDYTYDSFMQFFERAFCGMGNISEKYFEIIEDGLHVGDDLYSFYVVAKKV